MGVPFKCFFAFSLKDNNIRENQTGEHEQRRWCGRGETDKSSRDGWGEHVLGDGISPGCLTELSSCGVDWYFCLIVYWAVDITGGGGFPGWLGMDRELRNGVFVKSDHYTRVRFIESKNK